MQDGTACFPFSFESPVYDAISYLRCPDGVLIACICPLFSHRLKVWILTPKCSAVSFGDVYLGISFTELIPKYYITHYSDMLNVAQVFFFQDVTLSMSLKLQLLFAVSVDI